MRKSAVYIALLLLAGCAQQSGQKTEPMPDPEIGGGNIEQPVTPPVVEPETPVVVPVPIPEPEPLPEPEVKPEPKPEPVVTKTDDGKLILGSEEWLWISQAQQHIRAKVDDGKSLSSIGVSNVQAFERDGKDWVKFNAGGQEVELPVERWLKSKQSDSRQAVVKLRAKLGELNELTEFALTAGKGIVLGVNFIRDVAIVDSNRKFVQPKAK
ncbi:RimK/LysX family protein [Photobacterium rosenbergii]|uniref:putative ATP-dependent zinc protease n=1 Tax=Photobacterium rosenbergii TaxID=294936 RepID=UPI001C99AE19|nr:RimK/LysX family protein [Photobacterium rosenbergii]MBY5946304.1 RimK/LysX family protein [Photobacterium rosenbergii]